MRKWFLALSLVLLSQAGWGANLQSVGSDCGHVTTCTITIAATTAGSTVVAEVAIGGGTVSSLTVGAATSSTVDKTITYGGGTGQVAIISVHNVAAGVTSVSITFSATEWSCAIVSEESGLATSANLDQVNATAQGGGLTTWTSGNVTTTQASEVAYGYSFVPNGASIAFVPAAGWTALSGTGITSGQVFDATDGLTLLGIRQPLSSTNTYAASGTGPNDQYTSGIATYKVAGGGGGNPPPQVTIIPP